MQQYYSLILLSLSFIQTDSKMMRNDALISKMITNFHKENPSHGELQNKHTEKQQESTNVVSVMQRVLCHNFPSIPCDVIKQDPTLQKLIERSIQQIKYKKLSLSIEKTTTIPTYQLTLFPTINSEDLSNFVQERELGFYNKEIPEKKQHRKQKKQTLKKKSEMKGTKLKNKHNDNHKTVTGRKKIRKFYPRKMKHKDKFNAERKEFIYSDENLSMSVEIPEIMHASNKKRINYQAEPPDSAAWRIDYGIKQNNPNLNMFNYEPDRLQEKLVKVSPNQNVIIEDNMLDHKHLSRKEVLHPDVYIKKNLVRNNAIELNSDGMD